MRNVTYYHKETGTLHPTSVFASEDSAVELNCPPDHVAIDHPVDAQLDRLSQRIDIASGQVVDYQPPQPSDEHEWHVETRRWRLNIAATAERDAACAARLRITALANTERHLMRRLVLDPSDSEARHALAAIDDELLTLDAVAAVRG